MLKDPYNHSIVNNSLNGYFTIQNRYHSRTFLPFVPYQAARCYAARSQRQYGIMDWDWSFQYTTVSNLGNLLYTIRASIRSSLKFGGGDCVVRYRPSGRRFIKEFKDCNPLGEAVALVPWE